VICCLLLLFFATTATTTTTKEAFFIIWTTCWLSEVGAASPLELCELFISCGICFIAVVGFGV